MRAPYSQVSRSELQNSQTLPSVSMYSDPKKNTDGTIDIYLLRARSLKRSVMTQKPTATLPERLMRLGHAE
jgi:hypothetical protein